MGEALLTGSALAAFLAGMVAFFAPCCAFVMLPTYLASVTGANRWRTAVLTAVFVAGVATIAWPLTVGAAGLSQLIAANHETRSRSPPDPEDQLGQAAQQYGVHTPMLANPTMKMSSAYGMLGHGGMGHPTQDGHAFKLLDEHGKVLWHKAYTEMYVEPAQLLADMNAEAVKA